MNFKHLAIAAISALAALSPVQAAPVTYDFTVNGGVSGPLAGVTASGYFTIDDSILSGGFAGVDQRTGLLLDLSFTWNGISYDETTANTGAIGFDADGNLTGAVFGTNCGPGICSASTDSPNSWFVSLGGSFPYDINGGSTLYFGLASDAVRRPTALPEPGTLALLGLGLAGLLTLQRRRAA